MRELLYRFVSNKFVKGILIGCVAVLSVIVITKNNTVSDKDIAEAIPTSSDETEYAISLYERATAKIQYFFRQPSRFITKVEAALGKSMPMESAHYEKAREHIKDPLEVTLPEVSQEQIKLSAENTVKETKNFFWQLEEYIYDSIDKDVDSLIKSVPPYSMPSGNGIFSSLSGSKETCVEDGEDTKEEASEVYYHGDVETSEMVDLYEEKISTEQ